MVDVIADENMYKKLDENEIKSINYEKENYPLGKYLAKLTYKKISEAKDVKDFHWAKAKPLYIQPPSVFGGAK